MDSWLAACPIFPRLPVMPPGACHSADTPRALAGLTWPQRQPAQQRCCTQCRAQRSQHRSTACAQHHSSSSSSSKRLESAAPTCWCCRQCERRPGGAGSSDSRRGSHPHQQHPWPAAAGPQQAGAPGQQLCLHTCVHACAQEMTAVPDPSLRAVRCHCMSERAWCCGPPLQPAGQAA